MTNKLDRYFQCVEADGHWEFRVGKVIWLDPGTPGVEWKKFRSWLTEPAAARLAAARTEALKNPRFFRTCKRCGDLNNAGHMHDKDICQSCATRYLGVIY